MEHPPRRLLFRAPRAQVGRFPGMMGGRPGEGERRSSKAVIQKTIKKSGFASLRASFFIVQPSHCDSFWHQLIPPQLTFREIAVSIDTCGRQGEVAGHVL